jgi:acetyltransferase-like isoleucine patch superfamily enzyme
VVLFARSLLARLSNAVRRRLESWDALRQLAGLKKLGNGLDVITPILLERPGNVVFGVGCGLNRGFTVRGEGYLTVGDHFHTGHNVWIITSNHNFDEPELLPYDSARIATNVTIGDCVWIGDNVVITPGTAVGDGAVIAAGAVVTKNVSELAVVGGCPAKIIRYRNQEKWVELRRQGSYIGWPRDYDSINKRRVRIPRLPPD